MKKVLKTLTALTLAAVMLTSLCSCVDVKELRRSQGYYMDEEQKSIFFDGKIYDHMEWDYRVNISTTRTGFVAEKEKPLLVAKVTGDRLRYNEAGLIINNGADYYCLREEYNNIMLKIDNIENELDNYYFIQNASGSDEERKEIELDEQSQDTIDRIIEDVTLNMGEEIDLEKRLSIFARDDTKTFENYLCGICYTKESVYYIEFYDEEHNKRYHRVPHEDIETLMKLIEMEYSEDYIDESEGYFVGL